MLAYRGEWLGILDAWLAMPVQDLKDPIYYMCSETQTHHIEAAHTPGRPGFSLDAAESGL